jgi:hypothetical protein
MALKMVAPDCEFYPEGETEVRMLFDLRIAGSVDLINRERAVWQEQSDIEALDMDHFILIIRPSVAVRRAA